MPLQYLMDVRRITGNICNPVTEAAMSVDSSHPLVQKLAFRLLLLIVVAIHLQQEHSAVREPNKVIWAKLAYNTLERIGDLESQVIVLDPSSHERVAIKLKGFA